MFETSCAVKASVLPGVRFPYVYFSAGGGKGCRVPPVRIAAASAACKEESPLPVPAAAALVAPCLPAAAPRFFIFKSIRCPAAGLIISKRPARIKRGRLRDKDSLRVFNTLAFLDSPQTFYFQRLQQSACIKKSLERIKKSLERIKKSLGAYQKVAGRFTLKL